jgi:hypothetical protein
VRRGCSKREASSAICAHFDAKTKLAKEEVLAALMESPLYFCIPLRERNALIKTYV